MATGISAKHLYREAMEQVHSYNSKLLLDRRLRMPYIDNQTGLAQQDCHLWVSRVQRCAPLRKGQIYSYPSRRWMVRKRPDFVGASKIIEKKPAPEVIEETTPEVIETEKVVEVTKAEETTTIPEAPVPIPATTYEDYYDDEAFDSEFDSDEEFGSRKKKRKTGRSSRTSKKSNMALKFGEKWSGKVGARDDLYKPNVEEKKKFYDCQFCNKRYKNQQSLRYHYEHHNHNLGAEAQTPGNSSEIEAPPPPTDQPPPDHVSGAKRKKGMPPSSYCDFCLGSVDINKKSGSSEELISCADCGRSGHPSCLQFNENLTEQVKKYKWQCIECKCCCICGTSDNDEQLLFCDDCDRGYHMYCLSPPIAEPPEGSWQCQLCDARVKGRDILKVAVLPQHMDIGIVTSMVAAGHVAPPHGAPTMDHLPPNQTVHPPAHVPMPASIDTSVRATMHAPPHHASHMHAPVHASMHGHVHAPMNAPAHAPAIPLSSEHIMPSVAKPTPVLVPDPATEPMLTSPPVTMPRSMPTTESEASPR